MPLVLMPMFLRHCSMAPELPIKHGKIPRVDAPVRRQGQDNAAELLWC